MLSQKEQASLQKAVEATFTSTCTIYNRSFVADGAGSSVMSETVVTGVPCRVLSARSQDEEFSAGAVVGSQDVNVLLSLSTAIARKDRLVIGGITYEVAGIRDRTQRFCKQAVCARVD